ncbi:hypothetical protein BO71DRAFT_435292 [Aspergillus ellipticus CBS 707.79]|uniref:Uncharacterized protein n=1 Tax=Aspergillus ellipticus CBS 707.79 TaxID=1448320 RepID=A0A319ECU1_9EURO|nr:hypothetical protein BO71DRAFT_435292 [Aspergillus ellipticus CBS 707.79]
MSSALGQTRRGISTVTKVDTLINASPKVGVPRILANQRRVGLFRTFQPQPHPPSEAKKLLVLVLFVDAWALFHKATDSQASDKQQRQRPTIWYIAYQDDPRSHTAPGDERSYATPLSMVVIVFHTVASGDSSNLQHSDESLIHRRCEDVDHTENAAPNLDVVNMVVECPENTFQEGEKLHSNSTQDAHFDEWFSGARLESFCVLEAHCHVLQTAHAAGPVKNRLPRCPRRHRAASSMKIETMGELLQSKRKAGPNGRFSERKGRQPEHHL